MGVVTVITSGKGGLANPPSRQAWGPQWAKRGKRALLIDGDAGLSCLDHMLGIAQERVYEVGDVISGKRGAEPGDLPLPWQERLYLLAAPFSEAEIVSPGVMKQLVSALARYYDYIFIDCPAGLGAGFASAVAARSERSSFHPRSRLLRNAARTRVALEHEGLCSSASW